MSYNINIFEEELFPDYERVVVNVLTGSGEYEWYLKSATLRSDGWVEGVDRNDNGVIFPKENITSIHGD